MARQRWGAAHDELVAKLSPAALAEVLEHFRGRVLRVPIEIHETREQRGKTVLKRLKKGDTYAEAAGAAGIGRSTAIKYATLDADADDE